jgi:signal transduction histidine kinase
LEETLHIQALSYLSGELAAATETKQILDAIGHRLPQLGFSTFCLSIYDGQKHPSEWSNLILAYYKGRRIEAADGERRFLTSHLIPDELFSHERRFTWAVESLNSGGNQFGYIVFEIGSLKTDLYGALVRQISSALQDSLLLQKYKQAEETLTRQARELTHSNEELQRFAYIASHDLQEPLRTVTSYVQLLARRYKDQLDADASEFINFAVGGAKRMHALINDLLTYSQVDANSKPFAPTDCAMVLERVLANLRLIIEETGTDVSIDNPPTLMADDVQMACLFQNLIENAIKFRRRGIRPTVHIGAERADGEWLFSVRDNGIGIDPRYFEQIFVVFQRLHNQDEYEGTGIGLAMCKRIVERHGGHIWVASEPGKGSTFYFTMPDRGEELP